MGTDESCVHVSPRDRGVVTLTVRRPAKRNALSEALWSAIHDAVCELRRDGGVRAVIITGAGDHAFAAGSDVAELQARDAVGALAAAAQQACAAIESLEIPTIAAVNGHALGGGCELALACDVRFAAPHGYIGLPEVSLGFVPGAGGTWRLARLVGPAKAKELILGAVTIDMAEAHRIGLVNRVIPADDLTHQSREFALRCASNAPLAVRAAKLLLTEQQGHADRAERLAQAFLFSTEDRQEGTAAFLLKRGPKYVGR